MTNDSLKITGYVTAHLYEGSKLIQTIEQPNLIVDTGKNALARRIAFAEEPIIRQIAIGSGSDTPIASDTDITNQTAIANALFTQIEDNNVASFIATFPEGIGTGDIREVGLFDTEDTLISRTLFSTVFNKLPSQFLNVTWKLQVA